MNRKVQRVIDHMNANLHRKLGSDELARTAQISYSHLGRLFKAETGMPPGQYLQVVRMKKAAQLLVNTFISVKQIMIDTGYRDKALFARHFWRAFDMSPSGYRAKHAAFSLGDDADSSK